jgi:hypothetical protein
VATGTTEKVRAEGRYIGFPAGNPCAVPESILLSAALWSPHGRISLVQTETRGHKSITPVADDLAHQQMEKINIAPGNMGSNPRQAVFCAAVFFFFLALYALTAGGHLYSRDSQIVLMVTKSLMEGGDLSIPTEYCAAPGRGGKQYSHFGIGQSLAEVIPYALGRSLIPEYYAKDSYTSYPLGSFLLITFQNCVFSALACLYFFLLASRFFDRSEALALTFILGLGTQMWPYSKLSFFEPLLALCLTASLYHLFIWHRRMPESGIAHLAASGAYLGFMGNIKPLSFILVPVFLASLAVAPQQRRLKSAASFLLAVLAWMAVALYYNLYRYGSPLSFGYETGFSLSNLPGGLYAYLLSPAESIFFYNPIILLSLPLLGSFLKRHRFEGHLIIGVSATIFLLSCVWYYRAATLGPRLLVPLLPILTLPLGLTMNRALRNRRSILLLASILLMAGIFVQLSMVAIDPSDNLGLLDRHFRITREGSVRYSMPPLALQLHTFLLRALGWDFVLPDAFFNGEIRAMKLDFWLLSFPNLPWLTGFARAILYGAASMLVISLLLITLLLRPRILDRRSYTATLR